MKRSREPEEDAVGDPRESTDRRTPDQDGYSRHAAKITGLDIAVTDEDDEDSGQPVAMQCSLPPHKEPLKFKSYEEYETHYHSFHTNRCLDCRKNFPSEHLLNVHIEEWHDPLVVVKRDRGEHTVSLKIARPAKLAGVLISFQYSCFVEGCERKCLTHQKRRMHLVDKHMYPKNFFFGITKDGIDGRRSLLVENGHRRRSSSTTQPKGHYRRPSSATAQTPIAETKGQADADEGAPPPPSDVGEQKDSTMADLTGAMSALNFVPPSVRFGKGRAGFSRRER